MLNAMFGNSALQFNNFHSKHANAVKRGISKQLKQRRKKKKNIIGCLPTFPRPTVENALPRDRIVSSPEPHLPTIKETKFMCTNRNPFTILVEQV